MKIVTAAVLSQNGQYLLCQRGKNGPLALKWEFPGGKLEAGETPEACMVREIKEELGLDIEVTGHFCDTVYRYPAGEILLKAYRIQVIGGEMRLIVYQAAEWVRPERLLEYDLLPADVEIAEKIRCVNANGLATKR